MHKKIFTILMIGILFLFKGSLLSHAEASPRMEKAIYFATQNFYMKMKANEVWKAKKLDAPPKVTEGRTYIPLRAFVEEMDAKVSWDDTTKEIGIQKDSMSITLRIADRAVKINHQVLMTDAAPYINNGRTMVPLRLVSEALGYSVGWKPGLEKSIQVRITNFVPSTDVWPTAKDMLDALQPIERSSSGLETYVASRTKLNVQAPIRELLDGSRSYDRTLDFPRGIIQYPGDTGVGVNANYKDAVVGSIQTNTSDEEIYKALGEADYIRQVIVGPEAGAIDYEIFTDGEVFLAIQMYEDGSHMILRKFTPTFYQNLLEKVFALSAGEIPYDYWEFNHSPGMSVDYENGKITLSLNQFYSGTLYSLAEREDITVVYQKDKPEEDENPFEMEDKINFEDLNFSQKPIGELSPNGKYRAFSFYKRSMATAIPSEHVYIKKTDNTEPAKLIANEIADVQWLEADTLYYQRTLYWEHPVVSVYSCSDAMEDSLRVSDTMLTFAGWQDRQMTLTDEASGKQFILAYEIGKERLSLKQMITDMQSWQHPLKAVFEQYEIKIQRLEILNQAVYPVFYVNLPFGGENAHGDKILSMGAAMARENGYWTLTVKDQAKKLTIDIECDPVDQQLIRVLLNGQPLEDALI